MDPTLLARLHAAGLRGPVPAADSTAASTANSRAALATLKVRLVMGAANLMWIMARPVALALCVLAAARRRRGSRHTSWASLLALVVWAHQATATANDPVFRAFLANLWARLRGRQGTTDDLRYCQSTAMERVLRLAGLIGRARYCPPWWMGLGGDFTTICGVALHDNHRPALQVHRMVADDIEGGTLAIDWVVPPNGGDVQGTVVLIAGVGGDTKAPYIQDVCRDAIARSLACCVCLPRGLGDTEPAQDLDHVFDPSDLTDLHSAVCSAASATGSQLPVWIVGFSMGGLMVCRYMGEYAGEIPSTVRGAVAVSGAMRMDFATSERYERLYQPVIVPSLLSMLVQKYSDRLCRDDCEVLLACRTYRDLFGAVYARRGAGRSFEQWKESQEGVSLRHRIDRPLLVVSALDDPLHNPEMVGFEPSAAYDASARAAGAAAPNPQVAYLMTRHPYLLLTTHYLLLTTYY